MVNIFVAPGEAFQALREKPTVLFPLAAVLLSTLAVNAWYFQIVDYAWFTDNLLERMSNLSDEQREAMRAYTSESSSMTSLTSVLGSAISILAVYILQAGYLTLVSALAGDRFRFRHWFSLTSWTNLPYLLVVLVMAVNLLLSPNGQISLFELNSLSLSNLGVESGGNFLLQNMLDSMHLPMFWALALTVAGYQQWLQCGHARAAAIVLAPFVLVFGTMAFFAFN